MNHRRSENRARLACIARDVTFSSDLLALQRAVEAAGADTVATQFAALAGEVRELAKHGEQAVQQARRRKPEETL